VVGQGPWLRRPGVRLAALLVLATIPTAVIGVAFKDLFELWFSTPAVLTLTFAITGALLFIAGRVREGAIGVDAMTWWHALVIGVAQGLAITPGISRSGTTIVVAMLLGLAPLAAARFSFLISIPAILGAVVFKLDDADLSEFDLSALTLGGVTAMVSGYAALVLLVLVVKRRRLAGFAYYAWGMAVLAGALALWTALAAP